MTSNELSFEINPLSSCRLLAILDTSTYLGIPESPTIQFQIPGGYPIQELSYNKSAITIFNSNSFGLTNVTNSANYTDLPDGVWVAKISICPHNVFWAEKKWYRTCQIWCKYYTAFLKLKLDSCSTCYDKAMAEKLSVAKRYIEGVEAQAINCAWSDATSLYNIANNILDSINDCECS